MEGRREGRRTSTRSHSLTNLCTHTHTHSLLVPLRRPFTPFKKPWRSTARRRPWTATTRYVPPPTPILVTLPSLPASQYCCPKCGPQNARKGLSLQALPSLLFLQLKRFDFDYQTMDRLKVGMEGGREGGVSMCVCED